MRIRHTTSSGQDKIELQMTPMIDIVFQLLVFFVMTFKIVSLEGDFNVKMPLASESQEMPDDIPPLPPIRVRLVASPDGDIAGIRMGERPLASFDELHLAIRGIVGDAGGPTAGAEGFEVELDCDYDLHYENVIRAVTAVSGYVSGDTIVRLIERIKFAPPRGEPAA